LDNQVIATDVYGLELELDGQQLLLTSDAIGLVSACPLAPDVADRLRMEMAKAHLWEWNRLEELKTRAALRQRRYLGSWLVMCLGAFSAYLGYPSYVLPIFFVLLSAFLWWRVGYEDQRAEREAQAQRSAFRPEWDYLRERLEEAGVEM